MFMQTLRGSCREGHGAVVGTVVALSLVQYLSLEATGMYEMLRVLVVNLK